YDNEPNDAGDEDYGQFNFGGFGIKWNDMSVGNGQSYAMFEFTAEDSTAEININITEVNDPPVANNQSVETDEDIPLTIKLTGSDPENDPLT
ncbi:MAG: Ig-like domain-containing protein, partial [Flavobacteriaceae bacterium]|nr:Ig-like domain-containing protein [Flavobacteriaceae bacterium]